MTKLEMNIALLASCEALEMMTKKANVSVEELMNAILADPEGNTANYFTGLVSVAMKEVPSLINK